MTLKEIAAIDSYFRFLIRFFVGNSCFVHIFVAVRTLLGRIVAVIVVALLLVLLGFRAWRSADKLVSCKANVRRIRAWTDWEAQRPVFQETF